MTEIYAAHAHEYRKKGYSPLPLPPGQKFPPPDGWTGAAAPMASGPDVQAWTETNADGNIALRLPDGVIGIDVDQYGDKTGAESVKAAMEKFGPLPKLGRMSSRKAPSGIRLFRVPKGTKLASTFAAAGLGPDVEIIQHHHRYVVAAPSVHPNGDQYKWLDMTGKSAVFPSVDELPELPQAWIDALQPKAREEKVDIPHDAYDEMPSEQRARIDGYTQRALDGILGDLREMKDWEEDYRHPVHGYGWEEGVLQLTASLASLVKADWNALDVADVLGPLEDALPVGGKFTLGNGVSKFARGIQNDRVEARVFPDDFDDSWFDRALEKATLVDFRQADGGEAEPSAEQVEVELNEDDWPEEPWNEKGDAARTKRWANGGLKWLVDEEIWVRWAPEEHRWVKDPRAGARACQRALEVAEHTEILNYDDTPQMTKEGTAKPKSSQRDKFLHEIRNRWGIGQFERVAKSVALSGDLDANSSEFDADGMLLAVKGGAVDLRTGEFVPGRPELKITVGSDVVFDPAARAPMFERYLATSMPDPAMREYLQRVMGYSIIGGNPEAAFFIHWGPQTGNGKSVLMNIVRRIMGSQMSAASSKALIKTKGDKHSVEIADLAGPRILQMGETAEGAALDEEIIKGITGGDQIAARRLRESNKNWTIDGKIHILTNHKPHISASPSMKRRMHLIVWPIEILKRDQGLTEKIVANELSGVLNWLLEGCRRWQEELKVERPEGESSTGLGRPTTAEIEIDEYLFEEDSLAEWFLERVNSEAEDVETKSSQLYGDYQTWCWPRNIRPLSSTAFGRKLRERKILSVRKKDGVYYPLALKVTIQSGGYFQS